MSGSNFPSIVALKVFVTFTSQGQTSVLTGLAQTNSKDHRHQVSVLLQFLFFFSTEMFLLSSPLQFI